MAEVTELSVFFRQPWVTVCVRGGRPEGAKHHSPGRSPGSERRLEQK